MGDRFRKLLGRIAKRQGGFAVPTAMLMMLAAFATVSVGVVTTVRVQHGTVRDQGTKSALQVAEIGVNEALLHFNRIPPDSNPCSPVSSSGPTSGWCPAVSGTDEGGGTYTYQVQPPTGTAEDNVLSIVATGAVGNTTRRVLITAHSSSGWSVFGDYQVKAGDWIHMDSNAEVRAGAATNGDIVLASNARQCGQASVGIGRELQLISNSQYYHQTDCSEPYDTVNQEQLILPPVNQGDVVTNNSNGNFFAVNPISGRPRDACWDGVKGSGTPGGCGARHLDLSVNTAVTLRGGTYSLCKLTMSSNTALYVADGEAVVIYFDSPEDCGYTEDGVVQLEMASNARITGPDGSSADASLLFVGSTGEGDDFLHTQVHMSSNTYIPAACEQNFFLYAPLSDVTLNSNSTYCGGLAGKTLFLDSNARVWTPPDPGAFELPATAPHYVVDRFVECDTTPGSPPSAGC
jgi:hypothetical protein